MLLCINDDFQSLHYFSLTEAVRRRVKYYFEQKSDSYEVFNNQIDGDEQSLVSTLVGLMECGNDDVKISSCKFLFDLYNAEHILFSEAKASHLCTPQSKHTAQLFIGITTITIGALDKVDPCLIMPGSANSNHINQDLAYSTGETQLSNVGF